MDKGQSHSFFEMVVFTLYSDAFEEILSNDSILAVIVIYYLKHEIYGKVFLSINIYHITGNGLQQYEIKFTGKYFNA